MKPRKHRNSKRLTAKERARKVLLDWNTPPERLPILTLLIQRALAAHARQALRRDQRRDGK